MARVDGRFWDAQAAENRKELAFAVVKQREAYAWVASLEAQEGRITCRELVNRFGVRSLYDHDQGGEVIDPPIAYKALENARPRGSRWPLRENLVAQLYDMLVVKPGPWLNTWATRSRIADPKLRSVAVMLGLPLFELHGGKSRPRRDTGPAATRARKARFQRKALPAFFAQGSVRPTDENRLDVPLSALELLPEAEALVGRWLDGAVDLLAPEESGRLTAAPLDLK